MSETSKRKSTSFRLSSLTIERLHNLKNQVNKNTLIKLSNADIIEILVKRASADQLVKKVNDL